MLGRDLGVSVLEQYEKLFPEMESFYFLEPTQKDGSFELYFAHRSKTDSEKDFVVLIAEIYQYETARIIMNNLNNDLKIIEAKV